MAKPDKNKKEPLLVNTIPEGNNSLTSRAIFYQRKLYDKEAFSDPITAKNKPIDMWYDKLFYGRLNPAEKPVHLTEVNLKPIPGIKKDLYALNFVVDAFRDLKKYVSSVANKGILNTNKDPDDPYVKVEPAKAWRSVHSSYGIFMQLNYTLFLQFANGIPKSRYNKVKTFDDFISLFTEYIDRTSYAFPFTRTKFLTTRNSDPFTSGLIIEISEDLHSDDNNKYENYLLNDNFAFFKNAAQRYGFVLDKNAPWRLVADIGSPFMKKYLEPYGVTSTEDFFKKYYYITHTVEIGSFKTYIAQFYNSMVASKPNVSQADVKLCNGRPRIRTTFSKRKPIDLQTLEKKYDNRFWLRMYTFVRAREMNKSWNQERYEVVIKKAIDFEKGVDLSFALDYIERQVRVKEETKQNRNFSFRPL